LALTQAARDAHTADRWASLTRIFVFQNCNFFSEKTLHSRFAESPVRFQLFVNGGTARR
jgi:hypothetical protein